MLNKAILLGRLTADPELRHTPNGVAVTSFTLAVNRRFAAQGQERQADFIDIVAWRNTAEFVTRYLKKGSQVAVVGSIQTRTYKDKDDHSRKAFEVVADEVHFAEGKRADAGEGNSAAGGREGPLGGESPAAAPQGEFVPVGDDDELPF